MKFINTNDINYILGIIVAFYAAYILHYNIKFKVPIFLNLGAGRFVSRIGTKAIDNKIETKIKGLKFVGSSKFNKSAPQAKAK